MAPPEQRESYHARSLLRWLRDARSSSRRGDELDDVSIPPFGDLSPGRVHLIKDWVCSGQVRWAQQDGEPHEDGHVAGDEGGGVAANEAEHVAGEETDALETPFTMVVDWAQNEMIERQRWSKGRQRVNLSAELAGVEDVHVDAAGEEAGGDPEAVDGGAGRGGTTAAGAAAEAPCGAQGTRMQEQGNSGDRGQAARCTANAPQNRPQGGEAGAAQREGERCCEPDKARAVQELAVSKDQEGAGGVPESTRSMQKGAWLAASGSSSARGESAERGMDRRKAAGADGADNRSAAATGGEFEECVVSYSEAGEILISPQILPDNIGSFRGRGGQVPCEVADLDLTEEAADMDQLPETPCSVEPTLSRIRSVPFQRAKSGPLSRRQSQRGAVSAGENMSDASGRKKESRSGPLPSKSRKSGKAGSSSNSRVSYSSKHVNVSRISSQNLGSWMASPVVGMRSTSGPLYVPKHLSKRLSMPERNLDEEISPKSATPQGVKTNVEDLISPKSATVGGSLRSTTAREARGARGRKSRRRPKKSVSAPIQGQAQKLPGGKELPAELDVTVPAGKPGWLSNSAPLYTRRRQPRNRERDRWGNRARGGEQDEDDEGEDSESFVPQQAQQSTLPRGASTRAAAAKRVVATIESWLCGRHGAKETMRRQGSGKEGHRGAPTDKATNRVEEEDEEEEAAGEQRTPEGRECRGESSAEGEPGALEGKGAAEREGLVARTESVTSSKRGGERPRSKGRAVDGAHFPTMPSICVF